MSIVISFGKWGGVYVSGGWTKRLCLGWMAITFFPKDMDLILAANQAREATLEKMTVGLLKHIENEYGKDDVKAALATIGTDLNLDVRFDGEVVN